MTTRRFPPPWSIEQLEECFVVADANGQKLASISTMSRSAGR
jgi:hypothetical protein